ncbi:hypothetical protein AMQ84_08205 [Paenibacillus riograndensis]|uniref:AMP-dependent synthetase/ligase domain-containing protein n=1 Tax=Paenibacillus riograndensis TaxID=483937 RepID=A0A132U613_9BACL|nr:phenylacetate--CoA ligase family protein [Paenibacillus riograndensis]KWX79001.1 hypothetical protein AMQ84_08205 [Paenibacillus riograndensis]
MERLLSHLNYLKMHVPFYMERNHQATSIAELPIMTKDMIRKQYGEFFSNEFAEVKDRLVEFVQNPAIQKDRTDNELYFSEDIIVEETTGTSGVPFRCAKTKPERAVLSLGIWKQRRRVDREVSPGNLFQFNHIGKDADKLDIYNYDPENLLKIYGKVKDANARWLHTPPSTIQHHVASLQKNNIQLDLPKLKVIESNGEYLRPETKKILEEYFNVQVVNQYGTIETWTIGLSCACGNLHINENVHVELVDDDNNPITKPHVTGRLLLTALSNRLLPFTRYLSGDYGYFNEETCGCGNPNPTFTVLEGREINLIKGCKEKLYGNVFFHQMVRRVLRERQIPGLEYIQVIQSNLDHFIVYTNYFDEVEVFMELFASAACLCMERDVAFQHNILSESEIVRKQREKPNVFICRC